MDLISVLILVLLVVAIVELARAWRFPPISYVTQRLIAAQACVLVVIVLWVLWPHLGGGIPALRLR